MGDVCICRIGDILIYCVEDDDNIRELMLYTLKTAGFTTRGFACAKAFWDALSIQKPVLILLDIMLEQEDGIHILQRLKQDYQTKDIPVIMATAKGMEYDKVKCLDIGADDYLVKPFGMMEMLSRIKAVLRRCQPKVEQELHYQDIRINLYQHSVFYRNQKIDLTPKEFELLHLFLQFPKKVFTRNELLDLVWGTEFYGETRTVDVHIASLRLKLQQAGKLIQTVRGLGYRLEGQND